MGEEKTEDGSATDEDIAWLHSLKDDEEGTQDGAEIPEASDKEATPAREKEPARIKAEETTSIRAEDAKEEARKIEEEARIKAEEDAKVNAAKYFLAEATTNLKLAA